MLRDEPALFDSQAIRRAEFFAVKDAFVIGEPIRRLGQVEVGHLERQVGGLKLVEIAQQDHGQAPGGKTKEECSEAPVRAAVAHPDEPLVFADVLAEGIAERIALVEASLGVDLGEHTRAAHAAVFKILHPPGQVFDRRIEPAGPDTGVVDHLLFIAAAVLMIALRPVLDDHLVIVVEVRMGHAEWFEEVFGGPGPEGLARDAFDDLGQQGVAGVRVQVFSAWHEVECLLTIGEVEDGFFRDHVVHVIAGHCQQVELVAQAAGVMDQVADGDGFAVVGQFGHVLADVVVEREQALVGQHGDGEGGELLRHRGQQEHRGRRDGDVVLQVGAAVAALIDDLAVFHDGHRRAGHIGPVPRGEEGVYPGGEGVGG